MTQAVKVDRRAARRIERHLAHRDLPEPLARRVCEALPAADEIDLGRYAEHDVAIRVVIEMVIEA